MSIEEVLTHEIVDEIFLYISNLRAPLHSFTLTEQSARLDFASCHSLSLVSRRFAQCWRRFVMRYVLLTMEAVQRGRQLILLGEVFYATMRSLGDPVFEAMVSRVNLPGALELFYEWLDSHTDMFRLNTGDDAERAFYSTHRCIKEAARAIGRSQYLADLVRHLFAANQFAVSNRPLAAEQKDSVARTFLHFTPKQWFEQIRVTGNAAGDLIPQRLMQLVAEHFDASLSWHFPESREAQNCLVALRTVLGYRAIYDGQERLPCLPLSLFVRGDSSGGGGGAVLCAKSYEQAQSECGALLAAAKNELLCSPAERARALAFVAFRCAAEVTFQAHNWTGEVTDGRDLVANDARCFRAAHGVLLSSTGLVSAADVLLFAARTLDRRTFVPDSVLSGTAALPAHETVSRDFICGAIAVQTDRVAKLIEPLPLLVCFDERHPGAIAFSLHLNSLRRILNRNDHRTTLVTLTLPTEMGRVPTLRIARHPFYANVMKLSVLTTEHTTCEKAHHRMRGSESVPSASLPFAFYRSAYGSIGSWKDIGQWHMSSGSDHSRNRHMFEWTESAHASFDIRTDDMEKYLLPERRYQHAVYTELAAPSIPARPDFILAPLSERINYLIGYLAKLALSGAEAPAKFLSACTTVSAECARCARALQPNEYEAVVCHGCQNLGLLKRKSDSP